MRKGERPIGAAKGKQTNTRASCPPPPPPMWWLCACADAGVSCCRLCMRCVPVFAVMQCVYAAWRPSGILDRRSDTPCSRVPFLCNRCFALQVQHGVCRHRAVLFKYLCDRFDLPCRLLRGNYHHATGDKEVPFCAADCDRLLCIT